LAVLSLAELYPESYPAIALWQYQSGQKNYKLISRKVILKGFFSIACVKRQKYLSGLTAKNISYLKRCACRCTH